MSWSLQDAKNRFSEVVERAQAGEPQRVTKRGHDAVVVVATAEFDRLVAPRSGSKTFVDHLLSFPKGDFELPPREKPPLPPGLFDED